MASGRPAWLVSSGTAVQNMSRQLVNSSSGGSMWGNRFGSGSGKPAWISAGSEKSELAVVVKYLNLIGNPVLYVMLLIGLFLAISTATRRSIRTYSSAVYLSAMFFCDLIWVTGNYFPDYAMSVNKNIHFSDGVCMYIQAFRFIGRIGTSFIIVALVFERVLLLSHPAKFAGLAKPGMALIVCAGCILSALGISGYYLHNSEWDEKSEKCNYKGASTRGGMAPQTLTKIIIIGVTLVMQIVLNIILGVLICRKRKYKASDPIQNSLASARQHTKQLNRINLIAFIMSLQYILTNVPILVAPSLYWRSLRLNLIDFDTLKLIIKIIDLFALFLVASRAFLVCTASPKIRKEAWLALTCAPDSWNLRQYSISITTKQSKHLNSDIIKRNSVDKNIE